MYETVTIHHDVHFSPPTSPLFTRRPGAFAMDGQAGAVDNEMDWLDGASLAPLIFYGFYFVFLISLAADAARRVKTRLKRFFAFAGVTIGGLVFLTFFSILLVGILAK